MTAGNTAICEIAGGHISWGCTLSRLRFADCRYSGHSRLSVQSLADTRPSA